MKKNIEFELKQAKLGFELLNNPAYQDKEQNMNNLTRASELAFYGCLFFVAIYFYFKNVLVFPIAFGCLGVSIYLHQQKKELKEELDKLKEEILSGIIKNKTVIGLTPLQKDIEIAKLNLKKKNQVK